MLSVYGIPLGRFKNIPPPILTFNNLPTFVLKQYFSYIFFILKADPLDSNSDEEFIAKYRLSRECSLYIGLVRCHCLRTTKHNPPDICYTITIPTYNSCTVLLATGSFQRVCGDVHDLSVSRCIGAVSKRYGTY